MQYFFLYQVTALKHSINCLSKIRNTQQTKIKAIRNKAIEYTDSSFGVGKVSSSQIQQNIFVDFFQGNAYDKSPMENLH